MLSAILIMIKHHEEILVLPVRFVILLSAHDVDRQVHMLIMMGSLLNVSTVALKSNDNIAFYSLHLSY